MATSPKKKTKKQSNEEEMRELPALEEDTDSDYEAEIARCLHEAALAGSPADQAEGFLNHGYIPLPWQWRFHAASREADEKGGPVMIAAGGSRGPGKSHAIFAQITLDDMVRMPGLKGLFLRQTGKAAKESLEDLVQRVLSNRINYRLKGGVLYLENGSKAVLGGFKDEKDIDKYIGIEYDVIGGEEINQLTETKITKLRGSLRTSKENWRPRFYSSFNPGGIGHGYVKKTFVEPYRDGLETTTRFIPAVHSDNIYLNEEYTDYLNSLEGELGRAWREGNFDIAAGQFFTSWNHDLHVIDPFDIPLDWKRLVCIDYGFTAPSAVYWLAIDPEGNVYVYRELYKTGLLYEDLAKEIVTMTPDDEVISYWVADPAIWAKQGSNILAGAQIMEDVYKKLTGKPLRLVKGDNDRKQGWDTVRQYLKPQGQLDGTVRPRIQFFDTCPNIIRTLPEMVYDENNIEDLNSDLEDHGPDSLRYGLRTKPTPAKTQKEVEDVFFKRKMALKKMQQARQLRMRGRG